MATSAWKNYSPTGAGAIYGLPKNNPTIPSTTQKRPYVAPKTPKPKPKPKDTTPPDPRDTTPPEPQQESPWQPMEIPSYGGGWNFQMPSLPKAPKVTQDLINEWIERAKNEAGLQFDPQILAIQQELAKAELTAQQSKGSLPQYYQDIMDYISKWQTDETSAEQKRQYARGFGRSGELLTQENKIAEQALEQGTKAQTEKAQKLADIDAQIMQLQQQAGQRVEGAETARGQYVAARRAELEDAYVSNQQALAQQKFANQMSIQQFGLTAETQAFNQWLSQMEMANEINYQNQVMALQQESQNRAGAYTPAKPVSKYSPDYLDRMQSVLDYTGGPGYGSATGSGSGVTYKAPATSKPTTGNILGNTYDYNTWENILSALNTRGLAR